jgi:hypothetical protein
MTYMVRMKGPPVSGGLYFFNKHRYFNDLNVSRSGRVLIALYIPSFE